MTDATDKYIYIYIYIYLYIYIYIYATDEGNSQNEI